MMLMTISDPLQQKHENYKILQNYANDNLRSPATKNTKTTKSYKIMQMTISDHLQQKT